MPYKAIDPATGKIEPIESFIKKNITKGICAVCDQSLTIRADVTPGTRPHFWHGSSVSNCPSVKKNRVRYEDLPPSKKNESTGVLLKEDVKNKLHTIYLACQAITGKIITKKDFLSCLEKANKKNIWEYDGLTIDYVPYILLCFLEKYYFDVWNGKSFHPEITHFILDLNIKYLDDLWNKQSVIKQKIWHMDSSGDVIKKIDIKPGLNIVPFYFENWVKVAFPT